MDAPTLHHPLCNHPFRPPETCSFCVRLFNEEKQNMTEQVIRNNTLVTAATYEISQTALRDIIATNLGIAPDRCELKFDIGMDYGPMDREPGTPTLRAIRVVTK